MPQEFEEDVQAKILQRAMEMDNAGQHHEDVLLRTATELGIPHETVMAARDQVLSEQNYGTPLLDEDQEMFDRYLAHHQSTAS